MPPTPPKKAEARTDEPAARPVKALCFTQVVNLPDIGTGTRVVSGRGIRTWSNAITVDTIFEYRGEFIINGSFFIPKTSGALLGWSY